MDPLEGVWQLVDSRAWDAETDGVEEGVKAPYGQHPMGMIMFSNGRMLASLCNGDAEPVGGGRREFSSYGGRYRFDGTTLTVDVDIASDPSRIGGQQVRTVVPLGEDEVLLQPPQRAYAGGAVQRRELRWKRIARGSHQP